MNYSIILKIIGWVIQLEGIFFLPPALTGFLCKEVKDALIYLCLGAFCILLGGLLRMYKTKKSSFYAKEGFVAVALSWNIHFRNIKSCNNIVCIGSCQRRQMIA